jgi:hypothetical protein
MAEAAADAAAIAQAIKASGVIVGGVDLDSGVGHRGHDRPAARADRRRKQVADGCGLTSA